MTVHKSSGEKEDIIDKLVKKKRCISFWDRISLRRKGKIRDGDWETDSTFHEWLSDPPHARSFRSVLVNNSKN